MNHLDALPPWAAIVVAVLMPLRAAGQQLDVLADGVLVLRSQPSDIASWTRKV